MWVYSLRRDPDFISFQRKPPPEEKMKTSAVAEYGRDNFTVNTG